MKKLEILDELLSYDLGEQPRFYMNRDKAEKILEHVAALTEKINSLESTLNELMRLTKMIYVPRPGIDMDEVQEVYSHIVRSLRNGAENRRA